MDYDDLVAKFKKLPEWESGKTLPTLRQLESFARKVHVPLGYLFLSHPPKESIPIPDFRTFAGKPVSRPSPNLLDTIYACQERQDWYRDFARINRHPHLPFIASLTTATAPAAAAANMRKTLRFTHRECATWTAALRLFMRQAEEVGILVMASGVVGSNNTRPLDPAEFRGFALSDPLAPLVFINNRDTKAAQIFTLAHELAHLWLGSTALSNISAKPATGLRREETWCNAVAAELLVPLSDLREELREGESIDATLSRLAKIFKVSTLVILRRLLDAGWLNHRDFNTAWQQEKERLQTLTSSPSGAGGGDFYNNTLSRVSRRFVRALVVSTLEGQTLYRDAFHMIGISRTETFNALGRKAGVIIGEMT